MGSHGKKTKGTRARFETHWYSALYLQLAGYALVLLLWALPLPNPVKVLSVTLHETSHALAALLTGGRVFGFAISPTGAGVTFGIGGYFPLILVAGYLGSSLWGIAIYYISVRWRPKTCLVAMQCAVLATALLGWLSADTLWFGLSSMAVMTALLWTRRSVQLFFVRLAGSACCLYAPLEVVTDVLGVHWSPSVMGYTTQSDIAQLAELFSLPTLVAGPTLIALQLGLVIALLRWTCRESARHEIKREKAALRHIRRRIAELRNFKRVYTIR